MRNLVSRGEVERGQTAHTAGCTRTSQPIWVRCMYAADSARGKDGECGGCAVVRVVDLDIWRGLLDTRIASCVVVDLLGTGAKAREERGSRCSVVREALQRIASI